MQNKGGSKRSQFHLSYGMIFSIILIVVFLAFAFYAIRTWLNFRDSATAGRFYDELQSDIDKVWRSSESSEEQSYVVPNYADFVCFVDFLSEMKGENSILYAELKRADYGSQNFVFYPVKLNGFESKEVNHVNMAETTAEENPFCIKTVNGKAILVLEKNFGEALVTIKEKQ